MAADQLQCLILLFYVALASGFGSDCVRRSENRCPSKDFKNGSLSMSCSGTDFIINLNIDEEILSLSLFAECSKSCSQDQDEGVLYYYDLSGVSASDLNAIDRTINGSSKLGMPMVSETEYCRVLGCYLSLETFVFHSFQPVLCIPDPPTAASSTEDMRDNLHLNTDNSSSSGHQYSSTLVHSYVLVPVSSDHGVAVRPYFKKTPLIVGVSVSIAILAVATGTTLLLYVMSKYLHIYYYRRKPRSIALQYSEIFSSIMPDLNVEEKVKVHLDHEPISLATSQLSIFSPLKHQDISSTPYDDPDISSTPPHHLDISSTRTHLDFSSTPHLESTRTPAHH